MICVNIVNWLKGEGEQIMGYDNREVIVFVMFV